MANAKPKKKNLKPSKLDSFKTWQLVSSIVIIAIIGYSILNTFIVPRVETWLLSKFPDEYAVYKSLSAKYPNNKIDVNDQTVTGSQHQRTLTVTFVGKGYPSNAEKSMIEFDICSALGNNFLHYTSLVLQSAIEHRFLFFYYSESQSDSFTCNDGL